MPSPDLALSISAVERDTGLSKDTLRMWERRYGFPRPRRDAHGERIYPPDQVHKLQVVKRLLERGHRPGKLLGRPIEDLAALGGPRDGDRQASREWDGCLDLIRDGQLAELRRHLSRVLMTQGLQQFVLSTVAPLNRAVGDAWMRGELAVFEEHLYTEQIQAALRSAVTAIQSQGEAPRVLLTSLPHELHGIGLLMVEALLAIEGAACLSLGTDTPCGEIARAASAHRADIVALSFSATFGERAALAGLSELRALLPASTSIWAGGACMERLRRPVPGVELIGSLEGLIEAVKVWRAAHAGS
jgi:DNA-binding transcriptional MerR regulator/methylmalonyl-CoA mutase cobalamin-binding subunit